MGVNIKIYSELIEMTERCTYNTPNKNSTINTVVFNQSCRNIKKGTTYSYTEKAEFSIGSYSSYSRWLNSLNEFSELSAFQELINFTHTSGIIDTATSKKLYKDFKKYKKEAKKYSEQFDEEWIYKYNEWENFFSIAAQNGAIEFF